MSIFEANSTTTEDSPEITGQEETVTEETHEQDAGLENQETGDEQTQEGGEQEEDSPEQSGQESDFDYAKAYQELRRDYTRKSQELADLRRQQQPPAQQPGQGRVDPDALKQQFWDEFQHDPVSTLFNFANAIAQQQIQQHVAPLHEENIKQRYVRDMSEVAKSYPQINSDEGFRALNEKIAEIAQELGNPHIAQAPTKRIMKLAAQEIFGDSGARLYQKAKAAGKQEAIDNIRAKQGLSAQAGAKQKEQPKSIEDEIADSIVSAGRRGGIFG